MPTPSKPSTVKYFQRTRICARAAGVAKAAQPSGSRNKNASNQRSALSHNGSMLLMAIRPTTALPAHNKGGKTSMSNSPGEKCMGAAQENAVNARSL